MSTYQSVISEDEISRKAYEIWQRRGCPPGDGNEDWQAARAELLATRVRRNGSTQARLQDWWHRLKQKVAGQQ